MKTTRIFFGGMYFYILVFSFFLASVVSAQVPANTPGFKAKSDRAEKLSDNSAAEAKMIMLNPVKVMSTESLIPFGAPSGKGFSVLDMKGYDENFMRTFTFR